MPYSITKGGGTCKASEWAVIKEDDGKTMGCHATKKEAEDQVAAIYANEGDKVTHPHSHLARVRLVSKDREAQLHELIHQRNVEQNDENLYFWDAEISNDLLDSHFTHMNEKTLRNYAEDAERGVAFLKGHDWKSLPIGYSVSGVFENGEGRRRTLAGFYTVRGLQDTDELIARMEARLLRDVSVGFFGGRMICDICGEEFWDCRHFPGLTYEEKHGDVVSSVLATFTIDDARLSEVSGVFDGSTPEAMIRKAKTLASGGEFTPQQVHLLENRYRIALPSSATYPGVAVPATRMEERKMTEEEITRVRSLLGLGADGDVVTGIENLSKALDEANQRIAALEPQAKEGVQYRTDLIEAALAEGVRAQGNDFDRELYGSMLKDAPVAVIKRMRDDWKKVADQTLPAGRVSSDGNEQARPKKVNLHPDSAYVG